MSQATATHIATTTAPPEQGQLVSVRQRRYLVTEVAKSDLPDRPLGANANGRQHLVSLSSVEDDGLPGAGPIRRRGTTARASIPGAPPRSTDNSAGSSQAAAPRSNG